MQLRKDKRQRETEDDSLKRKRPYMLRAFREAANSAWAVGALQDLLSAPGRLLQYLLDYMLAGHEQDDDVTVLVMHVPDR